VLLIRRIRELLYEQGFTINGARNRLDEGMGVGLKAGSDAGPATVAPAADGSGATPAGFNIAQLKADLQAVADMLR
jgi:hypothetical protein